MCDAAEEQPFQRSASDAAQNDKVGSGGNGSVCDCVRRPADHHLMYLELRIEPFCPELRDLAYVNGCLGQRSEAPNSTPR